MADIRVDTKFLQHPKTMKLYRRLGAEGLVSLLRLWFWTAENRPDGILHGLDEEDIDLISNWPDPTGRRDQADHDQTGPSFCQQAMELGWIDTADDGTLCLHEWAEYNPWVADAPNRSDKARFSKLASVAPAAYLKLAGEGKTGISKEEYEAIRAEAGTKRQRNDSAPTTKRRRNDNAPPAPSPSPSPSPDIKRDQEEPPPELNSRKKVLQVYKDFPGYHADLSYKEASWADGLIERFGNLDIAAELKKAASWVELKQQQTPDFKVKNAQAYIIKWLERVQKERS